MNIREEIPNDVSAIRALTKKAFEPMPFSNGAEPRIIDALRNNEQLSLSLVAVCENEIRFALTNKVRGLVAHSFYTDWRQSKRLAQKVAFLLVTQTTTHALVLKIIQAWLIRA